MDWESCNCVRLDDMNRFTERLGKLTLFEPGTSTYIGMLNGVLTASNNNRGNTLLA